MMGFELKVVLGGDAKASCRQAGGREEGREELIRVRVVLISVSILYHRNTNTFLWPKTSTAAVSSRFGRTRLYCSTTLGGNDVAVLCKDAGLSGLGGEGCFLARSTRLAFGTVRSPTNLLRLYGQHLFVWN